MRIPRQYRMLPFAVLALSTLGSQCGDLMPIEAPSANCETNTAQIAIYDGILQTVCGCGGTDGTLFAAGSPMTCTYSLGKTLYIYLNSPTNSVQAHQLVPVGSPGLPATPVFNPQDATPIRAFTIRLTATGTYGFKDNFDGGLTGSIVVTP